YARSTHRCRSSRCVRSAGNGCAPNRLPRSTRPTGCAMPAAFPNWRMKCVISGRRASPAAVLLTASMRWSGRLASFCSTVATRNRGSGISEFKQDADRRLSFTAPFQHGNRSMALRWPWHRPRNGGAHAEMKNAAPQGFIAFHAQGEACWISRDYATLAREGFMRNPIVHRAVRLISGAASAVPWLLYQGADEIVEHPLLDLLERPNSRQAGATFMEALYGYLLLAGNADVELVEAGEGAREMHRLRPDRVQVLAGADGWPVALEHREKAGRRRVPLADMESGGALHLTLFHPLDDHYGFPPLEAALMALDTHNAAGRWNKALLDNSARPSGAL